MSRSVFYRKKERKDDLESAVHILQEKAILWIANILISEGFWMLQVRFLMTAVLAQAFIIIFWKEQQTLTF